MYPKNHLMSKRYKTSEGAKSKREWNVGRPAGENRRLGAQTKKEVKDRPESVTLDTRYLKI